MATTGDMKRWFDTAPEGVDPNGFARYNNDGEIPGAGGSVVSVSPTGTATDEVRYITIDSVEKKLAGGDVSSVNSKTGEVVLDATDIKVTTNQQTVEENLIRIDEALNDKQNTIDISLDTTSKNIVGAINEINNNTVHKTGNENVEGTKNFATMPNVLEPPPIPEGYTELTSIISNGTQRIDTGHVPTRNLKVYIEYIPLNEDDVTVFGAILNGSERVNFNTAGADVAYRAFDSTKRTISNVQTVGQVSRVLFDLHDGVYNINGNTGTLTIGDGYVSTYSLYLFALNAGSGSAAFNSSIVLLKCQIWDDSNVLKFDFIPSKNSSNTVGLYDQENDNFLQGEVAHPFVAGSVAYNAKPLAKFEDIDEEIDDRITTSIDSSSTDDDIPSAKAVYDIIGDIESILADIDSGNGGVQ